MATRLHRIFHCAVFFTVCAAFQLPPPQVYSTARHSPPSIQACCQPQNRGAPPLEELIIDESQRREDGPYDLTMISLFRLALGYAVGWQSPRPLWHYDGLVDISRRLFKSVPSRAQRIQRVGDLFRQFPYEPQLLQDNKWSMEGLALLTQTLFPFLVGKCRVESWQRSDNEEWRSKVVIERCRFLEASSCKGMCTGLCKVPSEEFFASIGLPLSMTPNFTDGSCAMVWGRTPLESDLDGQDMGCYNACDLLAPRAPAAAVTLPTAVRPKPSAAALAAVARARVSAALSDETIAVPPSPPPVIPPPAEQQQQQHELRIDIKSAGEAKGSGAFAAEDAKAGRWICQYVGTPITLLQSTQLYDETDPEYLFQITPDLYLDANLSTHNSRYFNHHEHGNLNFTVDKATSLVNFYASRDIKKGEELCFDYGMAYWAGSGVIPSPETDSRNYTRANAEANRVNAPALKGPKPITPTHREEGSLQKALELPDAEEVKAALLRCLEFYGATRIDTDEMSVPFGFKAPQRVIKPSQVELATLEEAATACVTEASAL